MTETENVVLLQLVSHHACQDTLVEGDEVCPGLLLRLRLSLELLEYLQQGMNVVVA